MGSTCLPTSKHNIVYQRLLGGRPRLLDMNMAVVALVDGMAPRNGQCEGLLQGALADRRVC